jgi:hypothetical protein
MKTGDGKSRRLPLLRLLLGNLVNLEVVPR